MDFNQLFDEWSATYDATVAGDDPEYMEVFRNYEQLLEDVASHSIGNVLEFGVGTGNLTAKLVKKGLYVFGVEPSNGMRKIAQQKMPDVTIVEGDFLQFEGPSEQTHTIVSTYAFHHLTDEEKEAAIEKYSRLLGVNGKIVFADTIFESEEAKQAMILSSENKGFHRLATDLKTEFYTTIPVMKNIFETYGFTVSFTQKNEFVWLMEATKQGGE